MKTTRYPLVQSTLAALAFASTVFSATTDKPEFQIQDLMSRYNQAEALALVKTARQAGFHVDPVGYRKSVRGEAFVALAPIINGNSATREQWARGRDVALLVVNPASSTPTVPAGLYVVRARIVRGQAQVDLVPIDDSGNPSSATATFASGTQAGCDDDIQHGSDYVCLHFCFCEFYGNGLTCGSFAICFTI